MARDNKIRYPKLLPGQQTFTGPDVLKLLGLKRERLRQWLNLSFIPKGYRVQWGSGSRVIFGKYDLYLIELFKRLVDGGIKRRVASRYSQDVDWSTVGPDGYKFLVVINEGDGSEERFVYLKKEHSLLHLKDQKLGVFIHLLDIVKEIDRKL
jgi:hypothetical protein